LLGDPARTPWRLLAGLGAGVAALLAMGAGAFVPVTLLGLAALRAGERRCLEGAFWREAWPALALLAAAWALRAEPVGAAALVKLHAASPRQFLNAFGRALAWPHTWMPLAALVLNFPLVLAVAGRLAGRRRAAVGEDFVLLIGCWSVVAAGAMAWARGGGQELTTGVTIRYVDFLLLLPIANAWCAVTLAREAAGPRARLTRMMAGAWGLFLFAGWLGLSAQIMRGFILPRMRDREAPVRLAVEFQRTNSDAVYAGQHPFFVPHPNLNSVRTTLHDPRMQGVLPPSFQPDQPMGPLSRAVRWLLGRE
ncbi:MAG: hypothetical protein ABI222_15640, partial [Opitutaceae bacterium]